LRGHGENREIVLVINTTEARKGVDRGFAPDSYLGPAGAGTVLHHHGGRAAACLGMSSSRDLTPYDLKSLHAEIARI